MQEVIFNIGVSGSGKTTWSTNIIQSSPNYLRINRDDIRKVLVGSLEGYYKRKNLNNIETIVTEIEEQIGEKALFEGYNLIIDNTNLTIKYINSKLKILEKYNKHYNANVQFKFKIFPLDNEYILRDRISKRDSLLKTDLGYLDKQLVSLPVIIDYINKNYKDKIINE